MVQGKKVKTDYEVKMIGWDLVAMEFVKNMTEEMKKSLEFSRNMLK